jgi:hypothetical protein
MTERPPTGHAEPQGRYDVWHKEGGDYLPVASVNVGNLLAAAVLSMHRVDARWQDGDHVLSGLPNTRSTTIGDVIVNPNGIAYEIATTTFGFVFDPIDFPPHREQQALFAEWRQDYAAARERDGIAALTAVLNDPPREPPANDNQIDRDSGRER